MRLFQRLGEAEAKAHGMPRSSRVHFHEVGAIDSIVDLVGAAAAVEHLAPARITCGRSTSAAARVETAHGELPVPAPATAELLRGIPIYGGPAGELTTPTGAVLLAELVDEFVELPPLVLEGVRLRPRQARDLPTGRTRPAAARPPAGRARRCRRGQVVVVECEVDDLPGEGFGFLMERLLEAGALDVYFTPVQMKKNRPGHAGHPALPAGAHRASWRRCSWPSPARSAAGYAGRPASRRSARSPRSRPRSARCGSSGPGSTAGRSPPRPSSRTAGGWRSPGGGALARGLPRRAGGGRGGRRAGAGVVTEDSSEPTESLRRRAPRAGLAGDGALRWAAADLTDVVERRATGSTSGRWRPRRSGAAWPARRCCCGWRPRPRPAWCSRSRGDGPLGRVIAEADDEGNLRGMVGDGRVDVPALAGRQARAWAGRWARASCACSASTRTARATRARSSW